MAGGNDQFTVSIFINGVALTTQRTVIKQLASTASSVNNITRSQPLFFSYVATAGDVLSIRYSKTSGAIFNIYSGSIGTNLFLMEVAK
jgi:DNA-directed RNA polymerase subunit H (RpoH/RPB5)